MARTRWTDRTDEELADGVVAGDAAAREEAYRRFLPLAAWYAKDTCRRLHERGGPCHGWGTARLEPCGGAFPVGVEVMLERIVGRAPLGTRGRQVGLLERWRTAARVRSDFSTFVKLNRMGFDTDVLRLWNNDRGLLHRPRPSAAMKRSGWAYVALLRANGLGDEADELGVGGEDDFVRVVTALTDDAGQGGLTEPIDVARTARRLLGHDAGPDELRVVGLLVPLVDGFIARAWPAWYGDNLSRPRQQTRTAVAPVGTEWAVGGPVAGEAEGTVEDDDCSDTA